MQAEPFALDDDVAQHAVGGPESDERDARLHQDALEDVLMDVVAELVGEHGFDLVAAVVR